MNKGIFNFIYNKYHNFQNMFRKLYYRNILKELGKNVQFYGKPTVICPNKVIIQDNCSINDFVFIHGAGGVTIGKSVTISAYVKIISTGLDLREWKYNSISGPFKPHIDAPIIISEGTWIGAGATILPGVKITGVGVVIAAGSIVTKDIRENHSIYGGIPAKFIKKIQD